MPELFPDAIVTCAGTVAAPLSEERLTTTPLAPAFCERVTVPVAVLPPVTDVGFKATDVIVAALPGVYETAFDVWFKIDGWPTACT